MTKKKVLVVDDDAAVRESLGKVLRDSGYEVLLARDGVQARERLDSDPVDLLLLDINLPQQNGWDTFERITSQNPTIPVIIVTGQPDQYPTALAAGVGALMEKPVDVPQLLQTIQELLAETKDDRLRRMVGCSFDVRHVPPRSNGRI